MGLYPCPFCGATATLESGCQGCGRPPDPEAAEVIQLGERIRTLTAQAEQARLAYLAVEGQVREAQRRRSGLAAAVRVRVRAQSGTAPAGPQAYPPPQPPRAYPVQPPQTGYVPPAGPVPKPETSTRTVQTVLFVLGGLLLGTAAIVFTAVAWATFGVWGRAAILATVTALMLAVPPLALRRQLRGTAETFAAVGLLLVILDGYAAWYVNLLGVADGPASRYAGIVCAVTALVAGGYGAATGLLGPRLVLLSAGQPVLPLLLAPADPDPAGWTFVFAAVAAADALVAIRVWPVGSRPTGSQPADPDPAGAQPAGSVSAASGRARLVLHVFAWATHCLALVIATGAGLTALAVADGPARAALAAVALITVGLVLTGAAVLNRRSLPQAIAGAVLVVLITVAAGRFAVVAWPGLRAVPIAAVMVAVAVTVALVGRVLPPRVRIGPWAAALGLSVLLVWGAGFNSIVVAGRTIAAALPVFAAELPAPAAGDWRPMIAYLLFIAAPMVLVPGWARPDVGVGGVVLLVLAAPQAVPMPWWAPATLGAAVALLLAVAAVRTARAPSAAIRGVAAVALAGYAVLAGLGRTGSTAAVLAAVVVAGGLVAGLGRRGTYPHQTVLGGLALTVGMIAWPPAVAATVAAAGAPDWWAARAGLGAVATLAVAAPLLARRWPGYRWYGYATASVVAAFAPCWELVGRTREPAGVYAAVALLLIVALAAAAAKEPPGTETQPTLDVAAVLPRITLVLPAVWWAVAVLPALWTLLARPYGWLDAVWRGAPDGVGLAPFGDPRVAVADAVALALAGAALVGAALAGFWRHRSGPAPGAPSAAGPPSAAGAPSTAGARLTGAVRSALPLAALVVPAGLAAGGVGWPAVPAATLLTGLAVLAVSALRPAALGWRPPAAVIVALPLAGSGLAGSLPERWATLASLGCVVAVAAAAGAAGRTVPVRVVGWLVAVSTGVLLAFTAGQAGNLHRWWIAYPVLGVAAAALALGALLRRRAAGPAASRGPAAVTDTPAARVADTPAAGVADASTAEAVAVEAAAQAGAVTAVLLSVGSAGHAAALCTLWGVALALRALVPGESVDRRRAFAVAAAGVELLAWWLLMTAREVALLEAYTLPAAGVGVLAGWWALRRRPALSSWWAYGPAATAGLLPSLASVLLEADPVRRLLLGLGALVVLLLGVRQLRQAPVVLGGGVLTVVALHELVLVWDHLPRWIPLAAAGLLLVGLAMTLERRRRDLARLRDAVGRMS